MKVLFDHQIFSMQEYGGISRYFSNLHDSLPSFGVETRLGLLSSKNHYIDNRFPGKALLDRTLFDKEARRYKWNKWYSRYLIRKNDFDIFHPTYYHSYFLKKLKKPFVLTVHDMIHEIYPQYFLSDPYKDYKSQVLPKADQIIAISESTKRDILRFYKVPEEKVTVIHHGYLFSGDDGGAEETIPYTGTYLLFVGERAGYKNFDLMLQAVSPVLIKNNISLICAGGKPFSGQERALIGRMRLENHVKQKSVTDSELRVLYKHAVLFIFPSLYEGFGLPILEAFKNGCPVAMSDSSSLREVGGNAACYFEPTDGEQITSVVNKLLEDEVLRTSLKVAGADRLKKFNFSECVRRTVDVYKEVI